MKVLLKKKMFVVSYQSVTFESDHFLVSRKTHPKEQQLIPITRTAIESTEKKEK